VRVSRGDSQGTRKWFARDNEQERLLLKKAHCSLLLKIAKVKSVSYIVLIANPLLIFFPTHRSLVEKCANICQRGPKLLNKSVGFLLGLY
jgi:hypothetical protein